MPHLLKRLELTGFKSFAGKTVLEFPEGITAIVGPNGSGKSNVVDAIRWLLGERDAKSLRGGKVEDLIFAGTPKRGRVGQASASLHFSNASGFFPIEYGEVTVGREVNRDGVSKYYLNGSEVLLRDLVDFFARVRLGARGLVVVTQGNSDLFLQASPQGRREMLEEVLGLREYQLKKADAERKLKSSTQNLEKVRALIEEILPHLRGLRRQTNRWEKRGEYERELKALEDQYYGREWQELARSRKEIASRISQHEHGRGALVEALSSAQTELGEVEAKQPESQSELQKIKTETTRLLESQNRVQKELGRLEAQVEMESRAKPSKDGPAHHELLGLLRRVKTELSGRMNADPEDLRRIIKQLLEEIEELVEPKASSRVEQNISPVLTKRLAELNSELQELEGRLLELRRLEEALSLGQQDFHREFKSAVAKVDQAKEELERWTTSGRQLEFERERIGLRAEELERRIQETGRTPEDFLAVALGPETAPSPGGEAERRIFRLRGELAAMGEVDQAVVTEAKATEERYAFLTREAEDLEKAQTDLRQLSRDLAEKIRTEFSSALTHINREFDKFFGLMFDGGRAELVLEKPRVKAKRSEDEEAEEGKEAKEDDLLPEEEPEEGIEVSIRLAKKRMGSLEALSGGERSLVGIAAIFAIISVSPPPFLVLDEIDAPLDERNARKFSSLLKEFSKQTQFVLVTHNRATMEAADVLYGVTLDEDGTSKILSMKLEG